MIPGDLVRIKPRDYPDDNELGIYLNTKKIQQLVFYTVLTKNGLRDYCAADGRIDLDLKVVK